ncbi:DUF1080 domain-containing protein [Leeuwenhoekiella sp. NPDC079379]|uniref:DUF1080 domain-containing protein n=1 Tax=Leeuwenhoekiella sp. NPDC079379 TaxID=3364122 RepID=UPI0037C82302
MKKITLILGLALALFASCKDQPKDSEKEEVAVTEADETQSEPDDWTVLFDGSSLDSWHVYNGAEPTQWKVVDDALVFTPAEKREGTENLVTDSTYTSFVLSLDWNISEGGNSGILWGVQENPELNEPYYTGAEIQVLDDERHPDAKAGTTHRSGALYDMIAAPEGIVKPAGEWNTYEITIDYDNNKGIVVMNGEEVVTFPVTGEEWDAMVAKSKFADWEAFAKVKSGKIALQDHGNQVSYRNIKIKQL